MSTRLVGSLSAGTRQRSGLGAWTLIVVLLTHVACATSAPRSGLRAGAFSSPQAFRSHEDAQPSTAESEAGEAEGGEAADERIRLSLPTRFGAVHVSDFELNEALTTLVLKAPLRTAGSRFPLYLHRKLALASAPLTGEAWRTPLARFYGSFCERQGTPGDCLELFKEDRKSTRLNSSHSGESRMPSSA